MPRSPFDQPPVAAVRVIDDPMRAPGTWPLSVPAVVQLMDGGLELGPGVTFLVGENGSGKSTVLEGIALAYGFSPEGGSNQARHTTRRSESPLSEWIELQRGIGASRWGFFLRAETMHSFYTYLEDNPGKTVEPVFHEMSHGESFLAILDTRFDRPGFYCLDEPEAALSFSSTLALMSTLQRIADRGGGKARSGKADQRAASRDPGLQRFVDRFRQAADVGQHDGRGLLRQDLRHGDGEIGDARLDQVGIGRERPLDIVER